jgi:hypothetical protein
MTTNKKNYYNKEYAQQYYLDNKEAITARNKKWQSENQEKMREFSKKYKSVDNPTYLAYAERHFVRGIWIKAKHTAAKKGYDFDLTEEDIHIPEKCPYLDVPLTKIYGAGQLDFNASIDRIDSTKGYVKGNVQIISRMANRMKNNASEEQLVTFANKVLALHSKTFSSQDTK